MAKGPGSPGDLRSGLDLLEGRLLMSYAAGSHAARVQAAVPVAVAPVIAPPRMETETGRSEPTSADVESRDAELSATLAASSGAKPGYTIPLFTPGSTLDRPDATQLTQSTSELSRFFQKSNRDDPVAWGERFGRSAGLVGMVRRRVDPLPEVPETAVQQAQETMFGLLSTPTPASKVVLGLTPSRGSDLLSDFLPTDQASLERTIDRLLDGVEGLGSDIARGVEAAGSVPSPVVWTVALATLELARRRVRRLLFEDDDGLDPDRDPAVGLRGFPA